MKVHDQQWEQDALESRSVVTHDGYRVAEAHPACAFGGYSEQCDVARIISAAPDMARALLEFIDNDKHSDLRFVAPGPLENARAALKKAGIL